MLVYLNGKFVPEAEAKVSVFDRGFLYGDGLFESIPIREGKAFRWDSHMKRFAEGMAQLGLHLPCSVDVLRENACALLAKNGVKNCLLRITLSRGVGLRGYSPMGAEKPTLVMSVHEFAHTIGEETGYRLITASIRIPKMDSLNRFKNSNKLLQIIARSEADAQGADDALMLNSEGHVGETSAGNIFWIEGNQVFTPPVCAGILPGITREVVLEICKATKLQVVEKQSPPAALLKCDGLFVTQSSRGVVEVSHLDGHAISRAPQVELLREAFKHLVQEECR